MFDGGSMRPTHLPEAARMHAGMIAAFEKEADAMKRLIQVESIKDEDTLICIAQKDVDADVRGAAVERISNRIALMSIIAAENDEYVRIAALARMGDQAILQDIARLGGVWQVRAAAVWHLDAIESLERIIRDVEEHEVVRRAAEMRMGELIGEGPLCLSE